jgi:hypothetical protein
MLNEIEFDKVWYDYDPYEEHSHGEELCMGCFTFTSTCHHCNEGLFHSNLLDVEGELMIEFLCDQCGFYFSDTYRDK